MNERSMDSGVWLFGVSKTRMFGVSKTRMTYTSAVDLSIRLVMCVIRDSVVVGRALLKQQASIFTKPNARFLGRVCLSSIIDSIPATKTLAFISPVLLYNNYSVVQHQPNTPHRFDILRHYALS